MEDGSLINKQKTMGRNVRLLLGICSGFVAQTSL